jgi:hypothetical protein
VPFRADLVVTMYECPLAVSCSTALSRRRVSHVEHNACAHLESMLDEAGTLTVGTITVETAGDSPEGDTPASRALAEAQTAAARRLLQRLGLLSAIEDITDNVRRFLATTLLRAGYARRLRWVIANLERRGIQVHLFLLHQAVFKCFKLLLKPYKCSEQPQSVYVDVRTAHVYTCLRWQQLPLLMVVCTTRSMKQY